MISIVCVYNKKDVLDEFLIKSLKNQSAEYELILMDNTNGKFNSAAEALNEGGSKAKGDYLMFVHQDVDLKSDTWLEDAERTLNSLDNLGIAGVAGRSKFEKELTTNIMHDMPPVFVSPFRMKSPEKVQTLDECLVVIPRSVFDSVKFDEKTCDDWHLYGVDYSLSIKTEGYEVYAIPLSIYHSSPGNSFSENYGKTLEKLLKKHEKYHNAIYTSMGEWVTFYPLKIQELPLVKKITMFFLKKFH